MVEISSVQDFVDLLAEAGDRLVVVEFFATWCAACKAMYPRVIELCKENPEIVFAKVKFEDNKVICKAMGVKALPFFQFYRGADGRLASFSASLKKFPLVEEALEAGLAPRCQLGDPKGADEFGRFRPRPLEMRPWRNELESKAETAPVE
ncbi:unnamed protein product [Pedinophyceae sp. YPF-701]|nr:unnamed protein product [Pedinophyceae sp. YPF-701]